MPAFTVDEMKLAFVYDLVRSIVTADGDVHDAEDRFLHSLCPPDRMFELGFWDGRWQTTNLYEDAFNQALDVLPKLHIVDKWSLLDACLSACLVDGALDPREATILRRAAILLGVSDHEFDAWLDDHDAVGSVELDDPE